jgi:hypothetical protein
VSRMKKAAAFLLVAILVLATASVAFGRHANGIYRTKPPANRTTFLDLSFTATKTKVKTVGFSYRVSGGCSSGASPVGDETDYVIPAATLNGQGKFSISVTESDGDKLKVTGKVAGRKASGTFRSSFSVGAITCNTGLRHWKALHLG